MSDEQDNYTVGGFREWQDGKLARDPDEALPHSGFIRDEQIDRQMTMRALHHDPDRWDSKAAATYMDVGKNRQILRGEGSDTARNALENGDTLTLKHYLGDPAQEADLSGIKAITRLQEIVAGPAPVIVLLGEMGAGKTNLACLLAQLRDRWVDGNMKIASNIRTLPRNDDWVRDNGDLEDGWIPHYPLLEEWVGQDGNPVENPQQPKLFIGDEFSTNASGSGEDGQLVRKLMGPLVFKIRKYNGALIYIGHDESSIHPLLWRVGTILKKPDRNDKGKALVAERISGGKLRDVDPRPLKGIPPADFEPHTNDEADWSWRAPSGDEKDGPAIAEEDVKTVAAWTMEACREQGMSARETAEFVPYSHATVSNWWKEIDEGGEKREWVDNVEKVIA
ncbi:hypothetical protein HALLA_17515 [Halostagnicola larsenii XH-48]|uniref:Uncharacterized protein n=1 Tax=Halostagnicola larsenii XH-48 TaxID=797299 RepID=W0JP27_9EURY|nr:hypothetical protein [Halostagnicola larsenii]AHG00329.1 hypothetical protein HALLA_17515 [Halostagnicola larsenii XH-48]